MTNSDMYQLLLKEGSGVLATHSLDVPGYPFGSVTPYCLDAEFRPHILVSGIAQHTKNMLADPRVSLTIIETSRATNKQAQGRLTYLADAEKLTDDASIRERYLRYFPEAQAYFKTHDFSFFRLTPVRLRYIGGFGRIHWVERDTLTLRNIFSSAEEARVVEHMNQDHAQNLREYLRHYLELPVQDADAVRLCGLDQWGMDFSWESTKHRIEFPTELQAAAEARAVLVSMAQAIRAKD